MMKLVVLVAIFLIVSPFNEATDLKYGEALSKCILFYEGQRSGYLPADQRMSWRGHSGLDDGKTVNVNLTGGYYDAGDHVKFNFPMAFTTTMLSWSVIEYGKSMPPPELKNALVAIKWSTDYLLKTVSQLPDRIFVQVGDPVADHDCWGRPEDLGTIEANRPVYTVEAPNPASDVAGETAAALAAASIAFRSSDPGYSITLSRTSIKAFEYADSHRGPYSDNSNIRSAVCPYYCDFDGYQDELLWGAAWLWKASKDEFYLSYLQKNMKLLGADNPCTEFGWDNKHAGINVLLSKEVLESGTSSLQPYKTVADTFLCSLIPESSSFNIEYSPGGIISKPGGSNLQHATAITFLLLVYADLLDRTGKSLHCGNLIVGPAKLRTIAKKQTDYILGDNPKGMSYMVGYGESYPQRIHHRGSSLPSIHNDPHPISCEVGATFFNLTSSNPNVLVGAVVGGPGKDDIYYDDRSKFQQSEPTTYINAPFVGVLAYFYAHPTINY